MQSSHSEHAPAGATGERSDLTVRVASLVGGLTQQRDSRGADVLSKGFELVVVAVVMGAIGAAIDAWLGTAPWFTLVLGGFAFAYTAWRMVQGYEADMRAEEARLLPGRGAPAPIADAATDDATPGGTARPEAEAGP